MSEVRLGPVGGETVRKLTAAGAPIARAEGFRAHAESMEARGWTRAREYHLHLFAVLLGARPLDAIFADEILHCGPVGLGWMRAMPAIGAFMMAMLIAHLPPMKHAGKALLWCVTGFGVATILFGLSKVFWLSLGCFF